MEKNIKNNKKRGYKWLTLGFFLALLIVLTPQILAVVTTTLNSPADSSITYSQPTQFNATGNAGVNTLKNMSFYTNYTGSWLLNQTINLSSVGNFTQAHGLAMFICGSNCENQVYKDGVNVTSLVDGNITSVVINYGNLDTCYIYNSSNDLVGTSPINTFQCILNVPIQKGKYYYVTAGRVSNYDRGEGSGLPVTTSMLTWTNGIQRNGATFITGSTIYAISNINISTDNSPSINTTIFNFNVGGVTKWNVQSCDNTSACSFATSNYTIIPNTNAPVVNVVYPTGTLGYGYPGMSQVINWTISTGGVLDKCWYSYNGTNTSVTCGNNNDYITLNNSINQTLILYANDTLGHLGFNTWNWNYYFFGNNEFYNPSTIEGNVELFQLNFSTASSVNSAYLVYNGTPYLSPVYSIGGINYIVNQTLSIPFVNADTNVSFYWSLNLGGSITNTSSHNQTIRNIAIDNCSTYTNQIFNFTVYDQVARTLLNQSNSSFDLNINIYPMGTNNYFLNFSRSYGNTSFKSVCINIPLNNSLYAYNMVAGYWTNGYAQQFYYVDNGTLTNTTNGNISLYSLPLVDSTTFLIKYSDPAGNPVPNAIIHLWRYYIGNGTYIEVENGKLDSGSTTHLHLTEEDVVYYFTVTLNNQLLYTTPTYNAVCSTNPCSVSISASTPYVPFPTTWTVYNGTSVGVSSNQTSRIISAFFVSNAVHTFNITLYYFNDGQYVIINSTNLTATAGTLSLYVPYPYGNQTFYIDAYQDGQFIKTFPVNMVLSGSSLFGGFGIFLVMLMVGCLALMVATDGILPLVFASGGIIISVVLLLLNLAWESIILIIIGGGLLAWKINSRKR